MAKFTQLLRRFGEDDSGAFMMIFGVMAIVIIALSGAVVDYVSIEQTRSRAQAALDAAVLTLQPDIYSDTDANISAKAKDLVIQQINDDRVAVVIDQITTNTTDGSLYIRTKLTIPTIFVALVGVTQMEPRIASEATRKKLNLEVVMVLDNSGSMNSYSRMSNLKTAAKNAVEILFEGEATKDNVFIGIVPFTTMVNAGPSYATASWVDKGNGASIANDNFDNDDNDANTFSAPVNRLALYNQINVTWRGCFEARPYPYSTDDTVPTTSNPDTLFVPAFAPDEPGAKGASASWSSLFYNSYLDDEPNACNKAVGTCTCSTSGGWWSTTTCTLNHVDGTVYSGGSSICSCPGSGNPKTCTYYSNGYNLSDREKQERLCKYTGSISTSKDGPNAGCPTATILPLNNVKNTVKSKIDSMTADGGTNIHQGAIWGFHVVSPTEPFTEGTGYISATSKVMILMTDGENTFYTLNNMNNAQFNQAYGFPYNQREGNMSSTNNSMATRMNTLLQETCTNIKAAGIEIYTIGLESPNTTTTNLLRNCASSTGQAYFPSAASELNSIFEDIANELADLRLAR